MTKWLAGFALVIAFGLPTCRSEAASSLPDSHDRALVSGLEARLPAFRVLETSAFGASLTQDAHACTRLLKSLVGAKPTAGTALSGVFTAAFVLAIPLTIDLADRDTSSLTSLRSVLQKLRPDSPLFARWRATEERSLTLILAFHGEGRAPGACAAATYLEGLAKTSSSHMPAALARFEQQVGISLAQYKRLAPELFANDDPPEQLASLAPTMRAFFVAAGASPSDASVLSSSE